MKRFCLLCLTFFLCSSLSWAEEIVLSGKQTKRGQRWSAKLESQSVVLSEGGTIASVEGARRGFWIERQGAGDKQTVYKCWNSAEAVGQSLGPGTYTVYPNLPEGEEEEVVRVYLQPQGTGSKIPASRKKQEAGSPKTTEAKNAEKIKAMDSRVFWQGYCQAFFACGCNNLDGRTAFASVDDCVETNVETEAVYPRMGRDIKLYRDVGTGYMGRQRTQCAAAREWLDSLGL
jgi:hypothetical protein